MPRRIGKLKNENQVNSKMEKICSVFGENIRRERKERKFTIDKMVNIVPISESYLGLLERGERTPSLECLFEFCTAFDCTPNNLLLPHGNANSEFVENEIENEENYKAAITLLRTFSEKELKYIVPLMINIKKLK